MSGDCRMEARDRGFGIRMIPCMLAGVRDWRENSMNCPSCGAQLEDGAAFCNVCGSGVAVGVPETDQWSTQQQTPQESQQAYAQQGARKRSGSAKRALMIAIPSVCVVIALVVVLINFVLPGFDWKTVTSIEQANTGDYVVFGTYEQDNDISDGKEDIEWLVLEEEDSKILVISRYALDVQPYNSGNENVTWENCSLRAWLNDDFYNNAFSSEEQNRIAQTNVPADKTHDVNSEDDTPGNDTIDNIFLLNMDEAEKYLATYEARICTATEYAIARDADNCKDDDGKRSTYWWLRSSDHGVDHTSGDVLYLTVSCSGGYLNRNFSAVRPAMWIALD